MSKNKIRVVLADDHAIFRQGLRSLLETVKDMEVVGETSTGVETVRCVQNERPDVVVMDIGMPDMNGIQASNMIKSQMPKVGIVILSMSGDEEFIDQAISAGVDAYLVKDTVASELIAAIREVMKGNAFFSPSVSKIILLKQKNTLDRRPRNELTNREKEILQFIAGGKTSKEIGEYLHISEKTVGKHRQQMMEKLGIHDVASLTRYAISKGLVL